MEPYKSSGDTGKSKSHDVAKVQSAWRPGGWGKQLLGKLERTNLDAIIRNSNGTSSLSYRKP